MQVFSFLPFTLLQLWLNITSAVDLKTVWPSSHFHFHQYHSLNHYLFPEWSFSKSNRELSSIELLRKRLHPPRKPVLQCLQRYVEGWQMLGEFCFWHSVLFTRQSVRFGSGRLPVGFIGATEDRQLYIWPTFSCFHMDILL